MPRENFPPCSDNELLKAHFDASTIKVSSNYDPIALGFNLTNDQIKGLCGAPSGSTITVTVKPDISIAEGSIKGGEEKYEIIPAGLLVTVTNPDYIASENKVIIYPAGKTSDGSTEFGVYIMLTDMLPKSTPGSKTFKHFGAYMIDKIVKTSRNCDMDFVCLRMQAAGGRTWNDRYDKPGSRWIGYRVWAKYGFDMDLLDCTKGMFDHFKYDPKDLKTCNRVSDLLTKGISGQEFWATVGDGWSMEFDLRGTNTYSLSALSCVFGATEV